MTDEGGGIWEAGARKNEWGWGICLPTPWWHDVLGNGLEWKLPVESETGMWQMGGKGYLRWWEARTLRSHDG